MKKMIALSVLLALVGAARERTTSLSNEAKENENVNERTNQNNRLRSGGYYRD